jgi:hypothetical protein
MGQPDDRLSVKGRGIEGPGKRHSPLLLVLLRLPSANCCRHYDCQTSAAAQCKASHSAPLRLACMATAAVGHTLVPVTVRGDWSCTRSALLSEVLRDTSLTDFARLFTLPELCKTRGAGCCLLGDWFWIGCTRLLLAPQGNVRTAAANRQQRVCWGACLTAPAV